MNDVSVEFCHIYQDKRFGEEQKRSISLLKNILHELETKQKTYITSVLVDDFHVEKEKEKWELSSLLEHMKSYHIMPDMIAMESKFTTVADHIISLIPERYKKREYFRKEKKHVMFFCDEYYKFALKDSYEQEDVHKCVILSCAWLLCKLGTYTFPANSITYHDAPCVQSHEVISILDKKYEKVERHVLHLLSAIGLEKEREKINYVFY